MQGPSREDARCRPGAGFARHMRESTSTTGTSTKKLRRSESSMRRSIFEWRSAVLRLGVSSQRREQGNGHRRGASEGEREDETDEPDFRDDRTEKPRDPVKVLATREEELKELERRVYVEADLEECSRATGKKPTGVRWVDVDKGFAVHRSRLVAKTLFRPRCRVDDVEVLYAATLRWST